MALVLAPVSLEFHEPLSQHDATIDHHLVSCHILRGVQARVLGDIIRHYPQLYLSGVFDSSADLLCACMGLRLLRSEQTHALMLHVHLLLSASSMVGRSEPLQASVLRSRLRERPIVSIQP